MIVPCGKAEGDCLSEVAGMLKGIQRGENIPVSNIYWCLALVWHSGQIKTNLVKSWNLMSHKKCSWARIFIPSNHESCVRHQLWIFFSIKSYSFHTLSKQKPSVLYLNIYICSNLFRKFNKQKHLISHVFLGRIVNHIWQVGRGVSSYWCTKCLCVDMGAVFSM